MTAMVPEVLQPGGQRLDKRERLIFLVSNLLQLD